MKLRSIALLLLGTSTMLGASEESSRSQDFDTAVKIARFLEHRPLDEKAEPLRSQMLQWLIVTPDLTVNLCTELFELDPDAPYSSILLVQPGISQAAFQIENPGVSPSSAEVYLAGIEGTLRAYEQIRREDSSVRHSALEELLERRRTESLKNHVTTLAIEKCGADAPPEADRPKPPEESSSGDTVDHGEMSLEERVTSSRELVAEGVSLHDSGDFTGAIEKYEQSLRIYPGNTLAIYELANTYLATGRFEECLETLEPARRQSFSLDLRSEMYSLLGSCYSSINMFEEAIDAFAEGLSSAPSHRLLRVNHGIALVRAGRGQEAIPIMEGLIADHPDYATPYFMLGLLSLEGPSNIPGLLWFSRFLMLEPDSPRRAEAASTITNITTAAVRVEPRNGDEVQITLGLSSEHPWSTIEMMLGLTSASQLAEATPSDTDASRFATLYSLLLTQLSSLSDQSHEIPLIMEHAVEPMLQLSSTQRRAFAYLIASWAGLDGASEWLASNEDQLAGFRQLIERP